VIEQRNLLIALERRMTALDELPDDAYGFLANVNIPEVKGFVVQQLADFNRTFQEASELEKRYFMAFVAFVAREQYIAKVGIEGNERMNGLASLWLSSQADKEQSFEILRGLSLVSEKASSEKPRLYFQRTEQTNPLANFRKGDNVVLYPSLGEEDNVLNHQIFKGFITDINAQTVEVALHYRQSNSKPFTRNLSWNAEKDTLDKSFTNLHQALFRFLKMPKAKRDLFLGLTPPAESLAPRPSFVFGNPNLSHDQQHLLTKILQTRDYFLLVGPPGTGKTKFMLAELVRYLLFHTQETVLLLAYTNRAVDEICDALHDFAEGQYLRIANEHSTEERYIGHLLDELAQKAASRKEILSILQGRRILVATISKLLSNPILLELVKVDTAIVDEASQVLEPYLAGILPLMGRFILIGDHKQLPAVVQQSTEQSALNSELLAKIGLKNRRNSLFERLYNLAVEQGWTWAYDHLQHQGRMHEEICTFPSQTYYDGKLLLLPGDHGIWQRQPLAYQLPPSPSDLERFLAQHRMAYFHQPTDAGGNSKTNQYEARQICELVQAFHRLYEATAERFDKDTIGIITPFRAQIGMIRHVLGEANPLYADFTIDTVERYQGGARDIILFSVCANTFGQMDQIVSASDDETVDRKLNVAITRARRHFILVGNEQLMLSNPYYAALIRFLAARRGN
jgi:DNA replication ATP-dependent helicase Dna2